jgi:hypothetical protein
MLFKNGKLVGAREQLAHYESIYQYHASLVGDFRTSRLDVQMDFRAYVKAGCLGFTGVLAALQPLIIESKDNADPADGRKVTIWEGDAGILFFQSNLRNDIKRPISIDYVECGSGCGHRPDELLADSNTLSDKAEAVCP